MMTQHAYVICYITDLKDTKSSIKTHVFIKSLFLMAFYNSDYCGFSLHISRGSLYSRGR